MKSILRFRKDNRGDTLVIVLVGIFLIGLLGSAILASTAMNYQMKSIDKGQKQNFYTAEQALDEVYAGIGSDVMNSMQYAYSYVLDNMLKIDPTTNKYAPQDNAELNKIFRNIFYYSLTGAIPADKAITWDTVKNNVDHDSSRLNAVYQNTSSMREDLTEHLNSLVSASSAYVPVVSIPQGTDNAVSYDSKIVTSTSGESITIDFFTLNDVTVTYTSAQDVTSRVSTDIVVEVPVVDINFSEVTTLDYGELLKYSIVAEGDTNTTAPTMTVVTPVKVNGNVYAGKLASEAKEGISLQGTTFDFVGSSLVSSGSIVLNSSTLKVNKADTAASMRLWARNLITEGDDDNIQIDNTDCVLKDDLQIDGSNSVVKITGSYYGIGYRDSGTGTEADSQENDWMYFDSTGNRVLDSSGNFQTMPINYEHENSSAILINGRDAHIDLTGLNNLLIAGRAYVDLLNPDAIGELNSTYMTGESISIKGVQESYLATLDTEYFNNVDGKPVVLTNPVDYSFFEENVNGKGILTNKTVAKRIGSSVYFYRKCVDPIEQTHVFEDYFNSTAKKSELRTWVRNLGVQALLLNEETNFMTVGAMIKVDNTKSESQSVLVKDHNVESGNVTIAGNNNAFYKKSFYNYVSDCNVRFKAMLTELKDYGDIVNVSVPDAYVNSIKNSTKTPFTTYVDEENMADIFSGLLDTGLLSNVSADGQTYYAEYETAGTDVFENDDERINKYNFNKKAAVILTKSDNYEVPSNISGGVVIALGNVTLRDDFTGLILCKGDIKIDSVIAEVKLNAHDKLVRWLADSDEAFAQCLKGYLAISDSGDGDASGHVTINNISYQDLVSFKNWSKLSPNAE